ncbi:MAG: XRE family transcriptional regulator [Oscillospiraceae bacterium]|nr:XRE family transcriptional regulator [Oscillospiraceae bacterium]
MLRLKELRKKRGLSLKEMGEIFGVAESTVSLYENSKREAPYSILHKAAEFFGVSVDYLLGGEEEQDSGDTSSVLIPILNSVSISEGSIEYSYSSENSAIELGDHQNYFFFKAHNDLMEPQISNGDIALIKKQDDVEDGELAAVIYEGSPVTLNRVIKENGVTVLQPFNPKYKSIFIKENQKLIILGKVVQTIRKW